MTTTTVENELLQLEKQYWRALRERDIDAALELTDFPCIVTGPQGIARIDEDALGAMMKDKRYTIDRVELKDDAQVRLLQDDIAVLAYTVHEELTVDGKAVTLDAADSSTWVRRNGRWRCALHTEAIAGDPFGRDRTKPRGASGSRSSRPGAQT